MNSTLKSQRLHIGIFGKRNAGKSSLINLITGQEISIVSDIAGTTTDAVEKVMELLPIGPVVLIDTAGIDDTGKLGEERIKKTQKVIDRIDIAFIVCDYNGINNYELNLVEEFNKRQTPFGIIINKNDIKKITNDKLDIIKSVSGNHIEINTITQGNITQIKQLILNIMPENFFDENDLLNNILSSNDTVVQVIPIDKEAPKGRLILPQVQTIRNCLDNKVVSVVTGVENLEATINNLKSKPKLVITDSQAFKQVNAIVPKDIMLTSYSIIFANQKGDLKQFINGAKKISNLQNGDKILIAESCTHHPICNDIGRVKIPNLIKKTTGKNLSFETFSGHDFPTDLNKYALIIQCGGCMTNKKEILSRILLAKQNNIPITNYGIAIAYCLGILDRAIEPFN